MLFIKSPGDAEDFYRPALLSEVTLQHLTDGLSAQMALSIGLPELQGTVVADSRMSALQYHGIRLFVHTNAADPLVASDSDEGVGEGSFCNLSVSSLMQTQLLV